MSDRARPRLVVEVEGPSGGRRTVALPADARIDDLVPGLVELCEGRSDSTGWGLAPLGESGLAGDMTLGKSGLYPGAVLILVEPRLNEDVEPEVVGWAVRIPAMAQRIKVALQPRDEPKSIDGMGDADYQRLLEGAIVSPGAGASMVVAVMSVHHGVGTTTVTALLATLLSRLRADQLVAVDASPNSGALSHWLAPDRGLSADAYRSLFGPAITPDQVGAALVRVSSSLSMLPGPPDPGSAMRVDVPAWSRLIEHLRHLHNIVIIDCGAGLQRPACRAALAAADHVVLVTKPQPAEIGKLRPTINSMLRRGRSVVVVGNQGRRARSSRSAAGFQQVMIAYEPQPAARLKMRGFSWSEAPASWQESVRELAAVLIGSRVQAPH